MKTRNLLLAMALPTLFAACTAEEIVNQADNNVLETRALLGDLSVKIENPVASRASWSEEDLTWGEFTEDDVLTSALVDGITAWDPSDVLLTNYIWSKTNGVWGTNSQMVEGIYSFYSYDGIKTKNDRKPIAFDLTAQTTDLDNPTQVINDNQLFFSPLYKIEAKNTTAENNINLPLTFYPYHSIAAFKMTNTTGQTLLVSQIIANGTFAAKGAILPTKIEAAGLNWYVRKNESAYKLAAKEWNTDGTAKTEYTEKEIKEMWQESDLDNIDTDGAGSKDSGEKSASSTLAMNCGNYEWADGEEIMAYMVMPANAELTNIEINVVDEEGEARYIRVAESARTIETIDGDAIKSIASAGITDVTFKRSVPVSVFGYTSAGVPKGINVKENNLASAKGYYIDTKEALEELVNISRGDIKVYNFGDLAVDAEVAEYIAEYTGGVVTFTNPIDIKDTEEVKISNINFGEVTVKGADATIGFEGTTVVFEDANVTSKLTIEAGATVTIEEGTYADVVNNGTLSIGKGVAKSKFENNGVMNVCDFEEVGHEITLKKGTLNYVGYDKDEDGTVEPASEYYEASLPAIEETDTYAINYAAGVNLIVDTKRDITPATDKTASLTVNGEFELNAELSIAKGATLTTAEEIVGDGSLVINGVATSAKEAEVAIKVGANATFENNGIANNIAENSGTIVTGANSKTAVAAGEGRINNTNEAQVSANPEQTVFYIVNNKAVEDLEGILFKRYAINTLRVTGTLTMDRPFGEKAVPEQLAVLKTLELAAGAEVKVDGDVHTMFEKVVVEGNAKIYGWSKAESSLTFDKNVDVVLTQKRIKTADKTSASKGYILTIADVTVGGTCADVKTQGHVRGEGEITFKSDRKDNDTATGYEFLKPELKISDAELKNAKFGDDNVNVDGIQIPNNATIIATAAELKNTFTNGGTVVLTNNVVLDGTKGNYLTTDKNVSVIAPAGTTIEIEGFGMTDEHQVQSNFNAGNVVFEGVTFDVPTLKSGWAMSSLISGTAKVTFRNCEFTGVQCPIYQASADAVVTIENCKFNTTSVAIQAEIYSGDFQLGQDLIIKNCDFGSMKDVLHIYDHDKNPSSEQIKAYLEANGNTFKGTCKQTCK